MTHTYTLNPKCINMGELYGEYNLLTNEWTDGLASSIIRAAVADTTLDRKWVVFDGPVDAVWIENMNTGNCAFRSMLCANTALCDSFHAGVTGSAPAVQLAVLMQSSCLLPLLLLLLTLHACSVG